MAEEVEGRRMTPATAIQNYLLMHLNREFPGLDVWRANVIGRRPGVSIVAAGEPGQADLTGVWGGRCGGCHSMKNEAIHTLRTPGEWCHFIPVGLSVWLEVKSPGDSQSATQRDFERRVTRLGALYVICRVRRKETVAELHAYFRLSPKLRAAAAHPAEIAAFFEELRGRL